jgi:hypothetical protein
VNEADGKTNGTFCFLASVSPLDWETFGAFLICVSKMAAVRITHIFVNFQFQFIFILLFFLGTFLVTYFVAMVMKRAPPNISFLK